MAQYPRTRAFYGGDGLVRFTPFTGAEHNGQYGEKRIGQGLIDFVELDFSKCLPWLGTAKSLPRTMEHYQDIRKDVFDVAEALKHKHSYVCPEKENRPDKIMYGRREHMPGNTAAGI